MQLQTELKMVGQVPIQVVDLVVAEAEVAIMGQVVRVELMDIMVVLVLEAHLNVEEVAVVRVLLELTEVLAELMEMVVLL